MKSRFTVNRHFMMSGGGRAAATSGGWMQAWMQEKRVLTTTFLHPRLHRSAPPTRRAPHSCMITRGGHAGGVNGNFMISREGLGVERGFHDHAGGVGRVNGDFMINP